MRRQRRRQFRQRRTTFWLTTYWRQAVWTPLTTSWTRRKRTTSAGSATQVCGYELAFTTSELCRNTKTSITRPTATTTTSLTTRTTTEIANISRTSSTPSVGKAYITTAINIRLRYDYDTTIPRRIRLRQKWSKLRYAFDSTAIRLWYNYDEKWTCSFFCSRRMEAGPSDASYVVVS